MIKTGMISIPCRLLRAYECDCKVCTLPHIDTVVQIQNKQHENSERKYTFFINVLFPILASMSKRARLFLDAS
jgi:hypothetical protein